MTENVRLQNLRDFTVQIRNSDDQIVGTGIAVSTDGKIVTCAHVVEAALGVHPCHANGAEVGVYFPQARGGEEKKRKAIVKHFFPDHDDDVVLLQLKDGPSPLAPEQVVVLGIADESASHTFRSYGYRVLKRVDINAPFQVGGWAEGIIMGSVDSPDGLTLYVEPVQLDSKQVAEGMSGSGVLDVKRNLVVGIISDTYYPAQGDPKDRDTAYAINARVLSLKPVQLYLQTESQPLQPAPKPKAEVSTQDVIAPIEKHSWNTAPPSLEEWTGRDDLLQKITVDWNEASKHVIGLIGFGGEGKSSLARRWVDNLLNDSSLPQPEGVFWWGFYENRNVDEFFESLLKWLTGGKKDPKSIPSSSAKAAFIAGMLINVNRYLFVLDGLEVLQHPEDDQFGLLQNSDLRDFITYLASPENPSFCLITSRTPLIDLIAYTTYSQRYVERLSIENGRNLLQKLKVKGDDEQLDKLVKDWDGHALTLSLLAGLLVDQYGGDVQHISDLPSPTSDEPRYDRVRRVLERYDKNLSEAEHALLKLFSVFRLPVEEKSFSKVFRKKWGENAINTPLVGLTDVEFYRIIGRLADRRIIHGDYYDKNYVFTAHPLIRNHYFALFTKGDPAQEKAMHEQIKDYYLSIAGDTPQYPTLDDLKPLIEVVYHACQAGAYDDGWNILWQKIYHGERYIIAYELGAFETTLELVSGFFPARDITQTPKLVIRFAKREILNNIGYCLINLGRMRDAVSFYEQAASGFAEDRNLIKASENYINLSWLYYLIGEVNASADAATQAFNLAHQAESSEKCHALAHKAWAAHLRGDIDASALEFADAEKLEQKFSFKKYLLSLRGVYHADHLRRTGRSDYARRVSEANLQICEQDHWIYQISLCHRVLGDLDFDAGDYNFARTHYESALKIARSISSRQALIEALLARGRWQAKHMKEANKAFSDLNEALGYCVESGYRIYEADVRVALAWAYLANGEKEKAKQSAERALQMSNEMGYHWGKVDAEEVLGAISG